MSGSFHDMKNKGFYLVNVMVMVISVTWFCFMTMHSGGFFRNYAWPLPILIITVITVYGIKFFRLYIAMYGMGISLDDFLIIYSKTALISTVLPIKIGEIFRMYCFGNRLGNYLQGMIVIILDRFMDTAALLTVLVLGTVFGKGKLTSLVYVLLFLLGSAGIIYLVFPGIYSIWRTYLLKAKASKHKLWLLKGFSSCNSIYNETVQVIKGRGFILYVLSLGAWSAEIGSIIIAKRLMSVKNVEVMISDYLLSAITGKRTEEMQEFVMVSTVFLLSVYILFWVRGGGKNKGEV